MRLPPFTYAEPNTLSEALSLLDGEPSAKILAGGTDLLVNMKLSLERPAMLVNIKRIAELRHITEDRDALRIGALATLDRLATDPAAQRFTALAQAASVVGSHHHQVMGTAVGNICQQNRCKYYNQSLWWRSSRPACVKAGGEICHVVRQKGTCYAGYCGDLAPALLVLDARVVLRSREGSREIALADLFTGDGAAPLSLGRQEMVTEIVIPAESGRGASSYVKESNRRSIDFPIVGAAFWASRGAGSCRVAFTAVDRRPLRAAGVETALAGTDLGAEALRRAAAAAAKEGAPARTSLFAPSYKRKIMGRLVHKAAGAARERSGQ